MSPLLKFSGLALMVCSLFLASVPFARAQDSVNGITIDVPVKLKHAKVLFNMDHASLRGNDLIGLMQMGRMAEHFKKNGTKGKIAAIFHGEIAYAGLNDEAYNREKKVTTGNPYKDQIKKLADEGVDFEFCANTLAAKKWTNRDLLPQFKVTTGAIFRIVDLVEQGYVVIHP